MTFAVAMAESPKAPHVALMSDNHNTAKLCIRYTPHPYHRCYPSLSKPYRVLSFR